MFGIYFALLLLPNLIRRVLLKIMQVNSDRNKSYSPQRGKVFLVGAGPGAQELLTLKALKVIQNSDVILYDNLVSEEVRALFPQGTQKIFVGKSKNNHAIKQQDLNQLMVKLARRNQMVCRLKGGDPFVFGRGGEEMLELHAAGVEVEFVPGITAASGCSGYAGIPLTHRGISQGCTFVTGHAEKDLAINWSALARLDHTLVFYMGLSQASDISSSLLEHGLSPSTPAALIENGSRLAQRVITTTLQNLPGAALTNQLLSPTLIVVGEVVHLQKQLQWFGLATANEPERMTA
jgi:uroporphyrin-III C-methyltransferase